MIIQLHVTIDVDSVQYAKIGKHNEGPIEYEEDIPASIAEHTQIILADRLSSYVQVKVVKK